MIFTDLYDTVNGLFDIVGKVFNAQNVLNTSRLTTVPTDIEEILAKFQGLAAADLTFDTQKAIDTIAAASLSWQDSSNTLAGVLNASARNYMTEIVKADSDEPPASLTGVLDYLIFEMERLSAYVDPNAVTLTLTDDPDAITNIGDVAILYSELRGDGRVQQNALAETIDVEVTSDTSDTSPGITFSGERVEANRLSHRWPGGSGAKRVLTAVDPASSLVLNGTFEDTTIANTPDGWTVQVGSPGNTVVVTNPEVQTIVIANSPSSASYLVRWVDAEGTHRTTDTLAHNASGSAVQTALRAIPRLGAVTVVSTGTSPNFTHTITFTGVAGNVNQLTSVNHLVGGGIAPTITHATTVPGNPGSFRGRSLGIVSDGAELTQLMQQIALSEQVVYFCHFRIMRVQEGTEGEQSTSSSSSGQSSSSSSGSSASSSSPSSSSSSSTEQTSSSSSTEGSSSSSTEGSTSSSSTEGSTSSSSSSSPESRSSMSTSSSSSDAESESSSSQYVEELRVEIVEGVNAVPTKDSEGNDNLLRIDVSTLSEDAHESMFFSFRLNRTPVQPIYLRIRVVDPWAIGDTVYIDDMIVTPAVELYSGGPYIGAVIGKTAAVVEDNWSLAVTNDRLGELQEWFHRAFDMAGKGFLLPTSGTNAILDNVIG